VLLLLWREQGARLGAPRSGVLPAPPENPAYAETVLGPVPAGVVIAPASMSSSTPGVPT
jgi:lipopolysaccharide export system permease protein